MIAASNSNSRAQAAYRRRQREAGLVLLSSVWVPAELVEQARKAIAELVEQHKAPRKPVVSFGGCECGLRTRLIGDGCNVCNPEYAAGHAAEEQK